MDLPTQNMSNQNTYNFNNIIHDYAYKPYPIFHGQGPLYIGVELEVDYGGLNEYSAKKIIDLSNKSEENLYIKTDSSLINGFELVSHPCSFDYHYSSFKWNEILTELTNMHYSSHDAYTCGLHLHVSKQAFGDSDTETQERAISRVIYFIEYNWSYIKKFSRRTEAQLLKWARRYGLKEKPIEFMESVKDSYDCNGSRYNCVNLKNINTVEFRVFRGTLKYNTFIATIEFVNELCKLAINESDKFFSKLSWGRFIKCIDTSKNIELVTYLNERNLI